MTAIIDDLKVLQRVQRLSMDPKVGQALLAKGFSNSAALVFAGQSQVVKQLVAEGISPLEAGQVFERARYQYTQVVDWLMQVRSEVNTNPAVMVGGTYKPAELPSAMQELPNLDMLFGPDDLTVCHENDSIWGAPAYLADLLRYLSTHSAEDQGTVLDILFERRPDIQRIKLNRDNTDTPLPYADLVCEVLEWAIPQGVDLPPRDFSHQTTWSPGELRASPEYIRNQAYDILRWSNLPMDASAIAGNPGILWKRTPEEIARAYQAIGIQANVRPSNRGERGCSLMCQVGRGAIKLMYIQEVVANWASMSECQRTTGLSGLLIPRHTGRTRWRKQAMF